MFTRVVEIRAKAGKRDELCRTSAEKILPVLRKLQGFQDEMVLTSNTDESRVLALSFWNKREDAERYHRDQFPQVTQMIENLCDGPPKVSTFDVNTSTVHHINLGKAA
jgi:heme-degrading monooxygenase HmoA